MFHTLVLFVFALVPPIEGTSMCADPMFVTMAGQSLPNSKRVYQPRGASMCFVKFGAGYVEVGTDFGGSCFFNNQAGSYTYADEHNSNVVLEPGSDVEVDWIPMPDLTAPLSSINGSECAVRTSLAFQNTTENPLGVGYIALINNPGIFIEGNGIRTFETGFTVTPKDTRILVMRKKIDPSNKGFKQLTCTNWGRSSLGGTLLQVGGSLKFKSPLDCAVKCVNLQLCGSFGYKVLSTSNNSGILTTDCRFYSGKVVKFGQPDPNVDFICY